MAGLSNYVENKTLGWLSGTAMGTAPAAVYVALSTTAYADDGTGGTELSGNGYARATATFGASTAGTPAGRRIANSATTSFPAATGGSTTPGFFAAFDATTGGNMLFSGTITTPVTISNGITPQFAAGALFVNLD